VPLTAQDVAEITRLLEESEFDELHIEHEGLKLTLRRRTAYNAHPPSAPAQPASAQPASATTATSVAESAAAEPWRRAEPRAAAHSASPDPSLLTITSPLVGIFYRAPKPGAPSFVDVGSVVEEDTIVGIIEVMKLMNAVRAEVRGTVVEILVKDGAAVEYGQLLLRIAPEERRG
jgi:acetyl-CoA carboxylase biotin carboxyl carrier protein